MDIKEIIDSQEYIDIVMSILEITGEKLTERNLMSDQYLREDIKNIKVAVIGDIMLDRYISGNVERISPEAPVPINLVKSQRNVLGGAANTAANLSSLGGQVFIAGMRGNDRDGDTLSELLRAAGIDDTGVIVSEEYSTTTKVRILGARQQMMRLDFEERCNPDDKVCKYILKWLDQLLQQRVGSIVLSDYGKGMITEQLAQTIIKKGKEYDVPVLIDPKGCDWTKYRGAYGITPNIKELSDVAGFVINNNDSDIERIGRKVRETFQIENIFVTRSEKGITCINKNGSAHCASVAQDVFDVSGAGDTVMAILAAATAVNLDMITALELANTAAGIAVSRVGTYPVGHTEMIDAWCGSNMMRTAYIPISWEEAKSKVDAWKSQGETVVFTNGCFDILHKGHITYLQQAAALGEHLIIGLNADESVKKLKGEGRPVNSESDRAFMLNSLRFVDEVVIFNEETPLELLKCLEPDILVKGGDYSMEDVIGKEYAGEVRILPFVKGYSTTQIINKILGK